MIPTKLTKDLNIIRKALIDALNKLGESDSFKQLCAHSSTAKREFQQLQEMMPESIKQPFDGKFVVAFVGNTGAGKTTLMSEMFPAVAQRQWLVTDKVDTTAQSLRIEYSPTVNDAVTVNSWNIQQLNDFCQFRDVPAWHEQDKIKVSFNQSSIEIDATKATLDGAENFRYAPTQTLKPFKQSYHVQNHEAKKKAFIHLLTTKGTKDVPSSELVLKESGRSYNALQLRAVVKDVTLKDDFGQIQQWAELSKGSLMQLAFVDTPGMTEQGSQKDEILQHMIGRKSSFTVLDLLKNDELDVLVHVVFCGQKSGFETVWQDLEYACDEETLRDLSSRLILAVNGTNIYFKNRELKKRQKNMTQFESTIDENILQRMSPRGRMKPARTCFVDSRQVVESEAGLLQSSSYEKIYHGFVPKMQEWLTPNSPTCNLLTELGAADTFKENMKALASADDRGQGFLMRQIIELLEQSGESILVKKYVRRTQLAKFYTSFLSFLSRYYAPDGHFNGAATMEALADCFAFLKTDDIMAIETFCSQQIDPEVDGIIVKAPNDETWLSHAFLATCQVLTNKAIEHSDASQQAAQILRQYMKRQSFQWAKFWGYKTGALPTPSASNGRTQILAKHSITTHVREIVTLFTLRDDTVKGVEEIPQTDEDKVMIKELMTKLPKYHQVLMNLCAKHGVAV